MSLVYGVGSVINAQQIIDVEFFPFQCRVADTKGPRGLIRWRAIRHET